MSTIDVSSTTNLNQAIATIDAKTAGSHKILFTQSITETANPTTIALVPGVSLAIDGGGFTMDGADSHRGLVVTTGTVLLENLTIAGAKATGSQGTAGGALLVGAGGIVTLENLAFSGNTATGGGSDIYLQ